ncbi:uncharacterized protein LOC110453329 isoform X1 [Mizuhopecten yessoensis]|uniref:uncharacterized protein LOC110453329 isoform X1 n=1 Tax=Mizuhopecten yessoensis TaxID=6573 RepID=UPI000B45AD2C|nr:uncharacterized protein LOC110453329 isoform X1 [Mizuhopecten yessoensis]
MLSTMNMLFLIYVVVMLSAMQQGPAVYRNLTCVEPEPGYNQAEKVCPTPVTLTWRLGNEVFCTLLCVLLALLFGFAPSIVKSAKEKWSMFQEWRARPSICRHCGTAPCQVKRRCLWKPSKSRKRDKANFAERSKAMMLFNYGLAFSFELTMELPLDDLYWERRFCDQFEEKHMVLFPLCIQRQINYWYPVPR